MQLGRRPQGRRGRPGGKSEGFVPPGRSGLFLSQLLAFCDAGSDPTTAPTDDSATISSSDPVNAIVIVPQITVLRIMEASLPRVRTRETGEGLRPFKPL